MTKKKEKAANIAVDDLISPSNKIIAKNARFVKGTIKGAIAVLQTIDNVDLLSAVCEFAESRYYAKKPMTARAVEMLLRRLDKIYERPSVELKIATIEKAIASGWQTVYPLSTDERNNLRKKGSCFSDIFTDDERMRRKINNFD